MLTINALLLLTASSTFYKCDLNGLVVYSQQPCPANAVEQLVQAPAQQPKAADTNVETLCLNYLRQNENWKDRDSLKVEGARTTWVNDYSGARRVLILEINAKNSYGAYSGAKPFSCYLNHNGSGLSEIQHKINAPKKR
ncbi:DUF4124 domain-containing protein [Alishewanella sp. SMS8]|uniref:DUF4124 domain-containing protein n=1 Tax=Alishewanella sp. SMS8 TaxID=2994676 RepID=UPI002740DB11|nr:DUF4124 domain-containing protein [Alishewanella sp. SMS8]MDP5459890.1 DUF4124 domain-containing protein [Alishewanella sp. SMS8]